MRDICCRLRVDLPTIRGQRAHKSGDASIHVARRGIFHKLRGSVCAPLPSSVPIPGLRGTFGNSRSPPRYGPHISEVSALLNRFPNTYILYTSDTSDTI